MKLLADASLPGLEEAFPAPFVLTTYANPQELATLLEGQDILFCRSTLKVNQDLLKDFKLKYVATASSGTDHIDFEFLKQQKIQMIDAKGSNASSVADYVVSCLAYLNQRQLIQGKTAGVIGMGMVGEQVAKRLKAAGFQIVAYDPLKASQDKRFKSSDLLSLFQTDLLCIHPELHDHHPYSTYNLLDEGFLAQLNPHCVIINAARGGIVDEPALENHPSLVYCTDVYLQEPAIAKQVIDRSLLCTPHIAGHSVEAKRAAVTMVSEKLHQLYGLQVPQFTATVNLAFPELHQESSWQELILSIYNPAEETRLLKQAQNKEQAFLTLRKAHQKRHDFSLYPASNLDEKTQLLLGL